MQQAQHSSPTNLFQGGRPCCHLFSAQRLAGSEVALPNPTRTRLKHRTSFLLSEVPAGWLRYLLPTMHVRSKTA